MTGTLMAAIDMSIINVALPYMRGNLGASVEEITWVSTGYILSSVIMMPLIALLSMRFGRKNFYIFCVLLFTGASMLCGTAWDFKSIVAFRVLQGIGGGALMPISQAVLRETWPREKQAAAMSIYGLGVIVGPALGPTIGGWLTDHYSWPWVFYINVPIGVINTLMVLRYIKDPPYLVRSKDRLDLPGMVFMMVGLGSLQIMLEKGERNDWFSSDFIVYLAVAAAAGLILFIWRELTTDKPAVDLRVLKNPNLASGTFLGGLLMMGLFGSLFILPLFLEQLLGYPATDSGLALIPRSLFMAVSMPIAGRVYNRVGPHLMIGVGLVLNFISYIQLSQLSLDIGYWDIFIPQAVQGIGFGLIFVSLNTAALITVENQCMTAATGLFNVVRQVFGSVGIALSATFLTRGENWNRAILMNHINIYSDQTTGGLQRLSSYLYSRGMDMPHARDGSMKMLEGIVMKQAGMLAFNHVFFLTGIIFLVSLPLIFLLKKHKHPGAAVPETFE